MSFEVRPDEGKLDAIVRHLRRGDLSRDERAALEAEADRVIAEFGAALQELAQACAAMANEFSRAMAEIGRALRHLDGEHVEIGSFQRQSRQAPIERHLMKHVGSEHYLDEPCTLAEDNPDRCRFSSFAEAVEATGKRHREAELRYDPNWSPLHDAAVRWNEGQALADRETKAFYDYVWQRIDLEAGLAKGSFRLSMRHDPQTWDIELALFNGDTGAGLALVRGETVPEATDELLRQLRELPTMDAP